MSNLQLTLFRAGVTDWTENVQPSNSALSEQSDESFLASLNKSASKADPDHAGAWCRDCGFEATFAPGICQHCASKRSAARGPSVRVENAPNTQPMPCTKCHSTGTYSWGAVVNGVPENSGPCYACRAKGEQDDADRRRNYGYWNYFAQMGE